MAHELKTPLAAVRGAARALAREPDLDEPTRQRLLGVIEDASSQAERLVADLLLAGRLGARQLVVELRDTDVAAIVEAAAEAARAAHGDATVEVRLPDGVRPRAMADPDRAREALANLVENAVAHGPAHGRVLVEVAASGGRVLIAVSDEGPGVPSADRERIFDPYIRLSERAAGSGLGLHLARGLARAMGGDVTLEPAGVRGSTFVLELPAA